MVISLCHVVGLLGERAAQLRSNKERKCEAQTFWLPNNNFVGQRKPKCFSIERWLLTFVEPFWYEMIEQIVEMILNVILMSLDQNAPNTHTHKQIDFLETWAQSQ